MCRDGVKPLVVFVLLALVLALPAAARAQAPATDPAAAFFDNTVLHDVYFTLNSKDWQTLKDNYLDNTYYPVDFKWGTTSVRNAGIRSRSTGSRLPSTSTFIGFRRRPSTARRIASIVA